MHPSIYTLAQALGTGRSGCPSDWLAFRRRYPKVRFHFVALGGAADRRNLYKMAKEGNGAYCSARMTP
jgi:hypothetical protein